ncbi:lectin-C-like [Chenopodium quinoa]|uniref:Chitin-binding type-1 domain-containing protein n=1 Tax=Chenopodium quinoa TaxID=63459 RepID=A0A803MCQ8_CHEQI|nr:lectin-C-like [Chenopodium quinoa]
MTMLKKSNNIAVLVALMMIIWMGKSTAFRCGKIAHNSTCPDGFCCNFSGYCGKTLEFCGKTHCQSQCQHEDMPQIQAKPTPSIRAFRTRKIPTQNAAAARNP